MTNTNGSTTTTVETLIAEVRVLMVGRRQITMSVAKQLDCVPVDDIEIFGRIRASNLDPGLVELIGRSVKTGALVTSWAGTNVWPDHYVVTPARLAEFEALPLIVLAGLR